jgi:hypothetical protein
MMMMLLAMVVVARGIAEVVVVVHNMLLTCQVPVYPMLLVGQVEPLRKDPQICWKG